MPLLCVLSLCQAQTALANTLVGCHAGAGAGAEGSDAVWPSDRDRDSGHHLLRDLISGFQLP